MRKPSTRSLLIGLMTLSVSMALMSALATADDKKHNSKAIWGDDIGNDQ